MTVRSSPHQCWSRPRWRCCLVVLQLNILGLVIINVGEATCRPNPITGGLDGHEGLLVDLINEQQKDFLLQLRELDNKQTKQPIGYTNLDHSKWIPVITVHQQPESLIASKNVSLARLDSQETGQIIRPSCNETQGGSWSLAESRAIQSKGCASTPPMASPDRRDNRNEDNDDDENDDDYDGDGGADQSYEGEATRTNRLDKLDTRDLLDARASVSLESSIIPPPVARSDEDELPQPSEVDGNEGRIESDEQNTPSSQDPGGQNESAAGQTPEAEAAERREQEAAEASEAEAANKSALAEQQQQQREIIKAQAKNEAVAIRQQQNALLKQQQLQHQILVRRDQELLEDEAKTMRDRRKTKIDKSRQQTYRSGGNNRHDSESGRAEKFRPLATQSTDRQQVRRRHKDLKRFDIESSDGRALEANQEAFPHSGSDTQFSDQPDNRIVDRGAASSIKLTSKQLRKGYRGRDAAQSNDDAHSVFIRSRFEPVIAASSNHNRFLMKDHSNSTNSTDLITAAQNYHDYGLHYGLFDVIHGGFEGFYFDGSHYKKKSAGYNQYIKSHKKGQFDSGFKRGNHKFTISGHSSQDKSHSKGHIKWKGTKVKGDHHWEYKHNNKKHYGDGYHGLGGGGHHYL